ncbi:MAG: hypothetical protein ACRERE_32675 [Candidatus Entotheonellia bacterium]
MAQRVREPGQQERESVGITLGTSRRSRTEFVLTVIAFIAGAVPLFMLLLGGMAAMMQLSMSMMDVMRKPPDPAMREPLYLSEDFNGRLFFRACEGYDPADLTPCLAGLFRCRQPARGLRIVRCMS